MCNSEEQFLFSYCLPGMGGGGGGREVRNKLTSLLPAVPATPSKIDTAKYVSTVLLSPESTELLKKDKIGNRVG